MSVNRLNAEPTFAMLINDVFDQVGDLAKAHADQLSEELHAKTSQAWTVFLQQVIGIKTFTVGITFVLVACVYGLIDGAGWAPSLAWLLVGGLTALAGAATFALSRRKWTSLQLLPLETLHSVRESMTCLSNR